MVLPLVISLCFLIGAIIFVWPMTDDAVINRLKWLKKQDRDLQLSNR